MILEIKAPTPGESITEVEITTWLVQDSDSVKKNQDLAEIESDKATLTLTAPEAGRIKIIQSSGETVAVG
jgi:Pyruvate/2-oxoglutarate dehydrogenase complex, dihydrolipoamide acyltransferase (E2) component, and related enzymes